MAYLDLELEEIKTLRHFFTTRQSLITAGTHQRVHLLRLDRSILTRLKTADISQESVTYVDDFEDDDDYDSDLEDDLMTDGATDFDDVVEEEGAFQPAPDLEAPPNEDLDELEDDADDDNASFGAGSVSVGDSDTDDDEEEGAEDDVDGDFDVSHVISEVEMDEADEAKIAVGLATAPEEEDELASNVDEEEDGEQWLRKHVDVLEAIDFDWRLENP